jgi:MGT family glycosyltransferase
MVNIGVICPSLSGHLNPMTVLARELQSRSHRLIFFQIPDLESRISRDGLGFYPIGQSDYPLGSLSQYVAKLGELEGISIIQYWHQEHQRMTEVFCRDVPQAIKEKEIELLLVDQVEPAGRAIAEYLNLPYITICNALALNRESNIPPVFTNWKYRDSWLSRLRNQLFYYIGDSTIKKYDRTIFEYRKKWKLPTLKGSDLLFANSPLAQISQQPPLFDFPRRNLPPCFHYCGPFRSDISTEVDFPYDKLNGKPLIYASLGTLQNTKQEIFQIIAAACQGLEVQLVIAHGGGLDDSAIRQLAGSPLVVPYAPQWQLLSKASLTITHAGLNTVLDSLSHGVPLITIPIAFEQPTIAARIDWLGVGKSIPVAKLNIPILRSSIKQLFSRQSYRQAAEKVKNSIDRAGGVRQAADIIEKIIIDR